MVALARRTVSRAKRRAILVALIAWLPACGSSSPDMSERPAPPSAAHDAPATALTQGGCVLVEADDASYWEGTLIRRANDRVEVRIGERNHDAPAGRVHGCGPSDTPSEETYAACEMSTRSWSACRVGTSDASVVDEWGTRREVGSARVAQLDRAAQSRARARIESKERERAFVRDASQELMPERPRRWRPLPGMIVVAWYGATLWREARITGVTPTDIELAWLGRETKAKRPAMRVAPVDGERVAPRAGELALARNDRGEWTVHRVVTNSTAALELQDRAGILRSVDAHAAIALHP